MFYDLRTSSLLRIYHYSHSLLLPMAYSHRIACRCERFWNTCSISTSPGNSVIGNIAKDGRDKDKDSRIFLLIGNTPPQFLGLCPLKLGIEFPIKNAIRVTS
jgi:hypothetical protein